MMQQRLAAAEELAANAEAWRRHKRMMAILSRSQQQQQQQQQQPSTERTDADVLRETYRFVRDDDDDDESSSSDERLARRYYARLYREFALADLSRARAGEAGRVGLRWRTEREVVQGKGQFSCGALDCAADQGLRSFEVDFAYSEHGKEKRALVKLRLCPACAILLAKQASSHASGERCIPREQSAKKPSAPSVAMAPSSSSGRSKNLKKEERREVSHNQLQKNPPPNVFQPTAACRIPRRSNSRGIPRRSSNSRGIPRRSSNSRSVPRRCACGVSRRCARGVPCGVSGRKARGSSACGVSGRGVSGRRRPSACGCRRRFLFAAAAGAGVQPNRRHCCGADADADDACEELSPSRDGPCGGADGAVERGRGVPLAWVDRPRRACAGDHRKRNQRHCAARADRGRHARHRHHKVRPQEEPGRRDPPPQRPHGRVVHVAHGPQALPHRAPDANSGSSGSTASAAAAAATATAGTGRNAVRDGRRWRGPHLQGDAGAAALVQAAGNVQGGRRGDGRVAAAKGAAAAADSGRVRGGHRVCVDEPQRAQADRHAPADAQRDRGAGAVHVRHRHDGRAQRELLLPAQRDPAQAQRHRDARADGVPLLQPGRAAQAAGVQGHCVPRKQLARHRCA